MRAIKRRRIFWLGLAASALLAPVVGAALANQRPPADEPVANPAPEPAAPKPMDAPDLAESVKAAIDAPFLKPAEAQFLRLFHGLATEADLDSIDRLAGWSLLLGRFDDPSLANPQTSALDRVEALLAQGDATGALAGIENDASPRAVRLRVTALDMLGRFDEAIAAGAPALQLLASGTARADTADQVIEAVRVAEILARLRAPADGEGGADHRAMMSLLRDARAKFSRIDWRIDLAEAELLYEKDALAQAQEALDAALSKNPSSAAAWSLLGQMAVNAFDMGSAEAIAVRLDLLAGASGSPLAAVVRARAMLRLNDPELAWAALAPALAKYPARRDLLEMQAAVQSVRFDEPGTEALLAEYDRRSPGSPRALFEAGKAIAEARQYARGADLLRRAVERQPFWPTPAIELGLLYIQSGEDESALATLERATELDPFNVRASNCLKLVRDLASYIRHESPHFVIRSKPGDEFAADALLAAEMLPVLEENHRKVTGPPESVVGGLDHEPAQRTIIELLPNHRAFAVRIVGMTQIHTIAASTGPIIAMETPREGPGHSGPYDWERVLRHEYTHTVGLSKTGNRIPHWFTEAQAVFLEQAPRDDSTCRLLADALASDELFDFQAINIAFVRPKRPQDRSLAYAQGHWMYEYMVETFGPRAPLKLMDLYAKGVREEDAFEQVLELSREKFFGAFRAWATEQVIAWGMLPPKGQPSVLEMLKAEAAAEPPPAPPAPPAAAPAEAVPLEPAVAELVGRLKPQDAQPDEARVARWLEKYPAHPEVLELALDQALAKLGGAEPDATLIPLLERYAAARPVDPKPHRLLARIYLALPTPEASEAGPGPLSAIPHLEFLDVREDRLPIYAAQLASLYARAGDLEKATQKAERATRVSPYDAKHRELAAGLALQRKDPATAKRHILALIALEPDRAIHKKRLEAIERLLGAP